MDKNKSRCLSFGDQAAAHNCLARARWRDYLRKAGVEVRGVTDLLGYKAPKETIANVYRFPERKSD